MTPGALPGTPATAFSTGVTHTVATAGYAQVKLTWAALDGATAYAIYRGANETTQGTTVASGITVTAYTDTTADTGTQYWYRVDATVDGGTVVGTAFQADQETGLEALKANGTVVYEFDGADRIFDGTKVVVATQEETDRVKGLTEGSVIVKFRYQGTKSNSELDILTALDTNDTASSASQYLCGTMIPSGSILSLRREWGGSGNYASGLKTMQLDDGAWHTVVFNHKDLYLNNMLDGVAGGDGLYKSAAYNGFFSRITDATTLTIGGMREGYLTGGNGAGKSPRNWVGELAYAIVTDEFIPDAAANALTLAEKSNVVIALSGTEVMPEANATVGTLTLTGGTALSLPANMGDNGLFLLDGTALKVGASPLTPGETYHVFVSGGEGEPYGFTIRSRYKDVTIALSGSRLCAALVGSEVGELTLTGADAGSATPTLVAPAAGNDNDKFELVTAGSTHTLKVKTALTPWTSYTVVVTSGIAGAENATFSITAQGAANDPLVAITGKTDVPGSGEAYPSYPQVLTPLKTATSLTVMAQFMTSEPALESIFGVGNSTEAAKHFHVYASGSALGYEVRGGTADIKGSVAGLRPAGLNTVAFVADDANYTIKLFINGKLMDTKQLDAATYYLLPGISGLDSVTVGKVARVGNVYPFIGVVTDLQVYASAKSDQDMLTYTAQTPAEPDFPAGESEPASQNPFYSYDATHSGFFRIPALLTLNNGDMMAAIDARFSGSADSPANLDTAVNFMEKDTTTWGDAFLVNNFLDYQNTDSDRGTSASFIDPQAIQLPANAPQHPNRLLMLADAYPYSTGINTNSNASISGMIEVDGTHYLAATSGDRNDWSGYHYYLKPNPSPTPGAAYLVLNRIDSTPPFTPPTTTLTSMKMAWQKPPPKRVRVVAPCR